MARIFISHSSHNNDEATHLRDWLLENGWDSVFLDLDPRRGIAAGERWKEALQKAAFQCEAVLALLSPEWLASDWCRPELNTAQLFGKKIFVLLIGIAPSKIPADLLHEQYVDLINDPEAYTRLKEGLKRAGLDPATFPFQAGRYPYPGFAPLEKEDAAIFFGREAQIVRGLDKLRGLARGGVERMLIILGASGCGKSSFLRAGLWPRLKRDNNYWLPLPTIRPERAVISGKFGLVEALHQIMNEEPFVYELRNRNLPRSRDEIEKFIRLRDGGFSKILSALREASQVSWLSSEGGIPPVLVIPIDQGEELFNEVGGAEARMFIEILVGALDSDRGMLALLGMRTDSFPQVQNDPVLAALPKDTFTLDRMLESSYRAVIEGPASLLRPKPLEIDPQLTDALLQDVARQDDVLALLAFTLRHLYDKYAADGRLSLEAYNKLGRLKGIIETTVKLTLAEGASKGELPKDEKGQLALIRNAFIPHLAGVNASGQFVRRVASRAEIPSEAWPLIDRFVEGRLLIKDRRPVGGKETEVVEVAHEALLREWKDLNAALLEQREFLVAKVQLEQEVTEWKITSPEQKKGTLLTGNKLVRAQDWLTENPQRLTSDEQQFIQASTNADVWRKRRRTYAATVASLVLATGSTIIFLLFIRSSYNFTLALLTKADQLLLADMPNRARIVAESIGESPFEERLRKLGLLGSKSDEAVRTDTIAHVAEEGSVSPVWSYKDESGALAAAFAPDGKSFVVGYRGGWVLLSSPATAVANSVRASTWLKGHDRDVISAKFSPDGKWLATATADEIGIWDLSTKQILHRLCLPHTSLNDLAFDPKGRFLAAVGNDGVMRIWEIGSWKLVHAFKDHDDWSLAVIFDNSGNLVATVGNEGRVVIRNSVNWDIKKSFLTGRLDLISVAYDAQSRFIATAALSGETDVWDLRAAEIEKSRMAVPLQPNRRWKVRYSDDGKFLAVASWDGTVRLFEPKTLRAIGTIDGHDHWVKDVAFATDSSTLLTVGEDGSARLWDLQNLKPMFQVVKDDKRETLRGAYSADGAWFVSGGRDHLARAYRVEASGDMEYVCSVPHESWVYGLAISEHGPLVATSGTTDRIEQNTIKVWTPANNCAVRANLPVGRNYIRGLDLSRDGQTLAWATDAGEVWLAWIGRETKSEVLSQSKRGVTPNRVAFSPDGKRLAVGYSDGLINLWDVADRKVIAEVHAYRQPVSTLRFHPNGKWIASGGPGEHVLIWDTELAGPSAVIKALDMPGGTNELAFSADGTKLAAGSDARYLVIWETESWRKKTELHALVGVRSVFGFHPKRGDLAFDGEEGLIRIMSEPPKSTHQRARLAGTINKGVDVLLASGPSISTEAKEASGRVDQSMACAAPVSH